MAYWKFTVATFAKERAEFKEANFRRARTWIQCYAQHAANIGNFTETKKIMYCAEVANDEQKGKTQQLHSSRSAVISFSRYRRRKSDDSLKPERNSNRTGARICDSKQKPQFQMLPAGCCIFTEFMIPANRKKSARF